MGDLGVKLLSSVKTGAADLKKGAQKQLAKTGLVEEPEEEEDEGMLGEINKELDECFAGCKLTRTQVVTGDAFRSCR